MSESGGFELDGGAHLYHMARPNGAPPDGYAKLHNPAGVTGWAAQRCRCSNGLSERDAHALRLHPDAAAGLISVGLAEQHW